MRITLKLLQLVVSVVGLLAFCGSLMLASTYGTTHTTANAAPVAQTGMFNPEVRLDTAQITDSRGNAGTDAEAEGQDVLPIAYHDAPPALWYSLGQQHPEWYDDDVAGIGTYWVPIGTVLHDDDGLYMATYGGWGQCEDFVTTEGTCARDDGTIALEMLDIEPVPATVIYGADEAGPCGTDAQCAALDADRELAGLPALDSPAYGTEQDAAQVLNVAHVTPVADAPATFSARCVKAAGDILRASKNGKRIEEDLSYRGMTRRAAVCNDELATAFYADGRDFTGTHGKALRSFLRHVVKTGQAPQVQTPGKVRAEDGSLVPHSFYDHVAGPTKATCDRLGKRLVPDATFGTRCA